MKVMKKRILKKKYFKRISGAVIASCILAPVANTLVTKAVPPEDASLLRVESPQSFCCVYNLMSPTEQESCKQLIYSIREHIAKHKRLETGTTVLYKSAVDKIINFIKQGSNSDIIRLRGALFGILPDPNSEDFALNSTHLAEVLQCCRSSAKAAAIFDKDILFAKSRPEYFNNDMRYLQDKTSKSFARQWAICKESSAQDQADRVVNEKNEVASFSSKWTNFCIGTNHRRPNNIYESIRDYNAVISSLYFDKQQGILRWSPKIEEQYMKGTLNLDYEQHMQLLRKNVERNIDLVLNSEGFVSHDTRLQATFDKDTAGMYYPLGERLKNFDNFIDKVNEVFYKNFSWRLSEELVNAYQSDNTKTYFRIINSLLGGSPSVEEIKSSKLYKAINDTLNSQELFFSKEDRIYNIWVYIYTTLETDNDNYDVDGLVTGVYRDENISKDCFLRYILPKC